MPHSMTFSQQFDALHEMASQATGLSDFGPDDYHEPMRCLLEDYDRNHWLTQPGIAIVTGELIGRLAGRLLAQQGFKTFPQYAAARIERPIIIIGMPRSGTTALHRLLSADPGTQSLEMWLAMMPMPRPPRDTWEQNPIYQQVAVGIEQLNSASPRLSQMHPVRADLPDECRWALDQSFYNSGSACLSTLPEYGQWCLQTDARYAYRRFRQILGLIAGGDQRRWLLKNPDHVFALDALLDVFEDACIVHTHRDPLTAQTSVASMSYEVLRVREPGKTPLEHGRSMGIWMQAMEKTERLRAQLDPKRIYDVHIHQFEADPVGTLERIYAYFELPVSEAARQSWRSTVSSDPRAGHGVHQYSPESFGLTSTAWREVAPDYCARYQRIAELMQ